MVKRANPAQRLIQRAASTRLGAAVLRPILHRLDKPIYRLSRGRTTAVGAIANLPVIMLSTTGAKTGRERTMPLLGVPVGDDIAILGTNFGQRQTPGWVYNLEADSLAKVAYRDSSASVRARRGSSQEYEEVFRIASEVYAGYPKYRERVEGREIRVFVLESID